MLKNFSSLFQKKKRGEEIEVFGQWRQESSISLVQDEMKEATHKEVEGWGVRVMVPQRKSSGKKVGFAATAEQEKVEEALLEARCLAPFSPPVYFELPRRIKASFPELESIKGEALAPKMREVCLAAKKKIKGAFPKAKVDARVCIAKSKVFIANSENFVGSYEKSSYVKLVSALLTDGGLLQVYEAGVGQSPAVLQEAVEEKIVTKLKAAKRIVKVSKLDWIIFSPKASEHLFAPLKMALSGDYVAKKVSPLFEKQGEVVFSKELTILDHPRLKEGILSQPFDGEGVASLPLVLIRKGKVEHFLLDLKTAALLKMESNGRASRSAFSLPSPASTNWVISPGEKPLLSLLKEGTSLVIDQGIGWAGNPLSGAVAFNVELGFVWKDGECLGRCKDLMVSGNVYDILKDEVVLTEEREWAFGEILSPYIGVRRMHYTQGG